MDDKHRQLGGSIHLPTYAVVLVHQYSMYTHHIPTYDKTGERRLWESFGPEHETVTHFQKMSRTILSDLASMHIFRRMVHGWESDSLFRGYLPPTRVRLLAVVMKMKIATSNGKGWCTTYLVYLSSSCFCWLPAWCASHQMLLQHS